MGAVLFAFSEVGIPYNNWTRLSFFDDVRIDVGGHTWSLNELESGLLRANRRAPYHFSHPFSHGDPRLAAALQEPERRIHFALNCGAKSCPPVKNFTEEAIQEELRIVASAFCEMPENVILEAEPGAAPTLWLSKIFEWYKADFGDGGVEAAKIVVQWLRGQQQEELQRAIDSGRLRVRSKPYDWSTNASRSLKYGANSAQVVGPKTQAEVAGANSGSTAKDKCGCCVVS